MSARKSDRTLLGFAIVSCALFALAVLVKVV